MSRPDGVTSKACPACHRFMDPERARWWTAYGSACSEGCARDLIREREGGIHRPERGR